MLKYILKRILYIIPIVFCVTLLVFWLVSLIPGDAASIILGENRDADSIAALQAELGLDQPFFTRFFNYLNGVLHGDLGTSYISRDSVAVEIASRLPNTLILTFWATLVSIVIGVAVGVISAVKQYSWLDNIGTFIALFGASAPSFWIALMFVIFFSVKLGWFPSSGTYGPEYWVLPVAVLGLQSASEIMRFTRSAMLEVVRQDYIKTARATGEKETVVILRHALKNAMMPIITALGNTVCNLLTGAILVETIFSIPGIGKYLIEAVYARNAPVICSTVLIIAIMCAIVNLIVDLAYALIDPRILSLYSKKKGGSKAE